MFNEKLKEENVKLKEENKELNEDNKSFRKELFTQVEILRNLEDKINKNEVLLTNSIKNILIEALRIKELYDLKILIEEHKDLKGNDGARRSFIAINKEIIKNAS